MPNRRACLVRTLAVLLGLAAALLMSELGLRTADTFGWIDDWRSTRIALSSSIWMKSGNPALIYQHRPDFVRDEIRFTEAHGILRPVDVSVDRKPGSLRIAGLGDSVAAAIKLPYNDRVYSVLERILAARRGDRVEVLNFSVNGYSTAQEAASLDELASVFRPDAIVLQYCVNDFYPTEYPTWWFRDRPALYLFDLAWRRMNPGVLRGYPTADYWARLYRTDRRGWESVVHGFTRIAAYCRTHSLPAWLVVFPAISHEGWDAGDARSRHARVATLGRDTGFQVLDLLPLYSKYPVEALRFERWDTYHPNSLGHRIAAEAIADALSTLHPPGG